jgi:hypothetical protein
MTPARLAAFAAAALLTMPASAATTASSTCTRDVAQSETTLVKTLVRLQSVGKAGQDEKCAAFRHYVDVVGKAREVFARCKAGRDRDADIRQLDGALEGATGMVAKTCGSSASTP